MTGDHRPARQEAGRQGASEVEIGMKSKRRAERRSRPWRGPYTTTVSTPSVARRKSATCASASRLGNCSNGASTPPSPTSSPMPPQRPPKAFVRERAGLDLAQAADRGPPAFNHDRARRSGLTPSENLPMVSVRMPKASAVASTGIHFSIQSGHQAGHERDGG